MPCCLFENRPLTFSLVLPPEHGWRRHPGEGDRRFRFCIAVIASSSQGLSTFETRSPYGRTREK
jgi:hypothetical protein